MRGKLNMVAERRYKHWSEEEREYLRANWGLLSIEEIASNLNRPVGGVHNQAYRGMKLKNIHGGHCKRWTKEEINYLKDNWGKYKLSTIAKKMNRLEINIVKKAWQIGLGPQVQWYTMVEIQDMVGLHRTSIVKIIKRHNLKYCKDTTNLNRYQMNEDQIKVMLETVPNSWNYYNLTVDLWGKKKPQWLKEKIEADKYKTRKKYKYWTEKEDFILLDRIKNNCSIERIMLETGRCEKSIRDRLNYKYNIKL